MTCIVGYCNGKHSWLKGDLCGSDGYYNLNVKHQKVFKKEILVNKKMSSLIIGYTTSFRMGQLIEHSFKCPDMTGEDALNYLINVFVPSLSSLFESNKYAKIENNVISGGNFLIGFQGRLFAIQNDFSVLEDVCSYNSCGCGRSFALGSMRFIDDNKNMFTVKNEDAYAELILNEGLISAQKFSYGVDYIEQSIIIKE